MSEENLNWFNKKYTNNYETEVLFNWASNISLENISNNYRKELFLEDKIIYFYGGNMGHAQDMLNLLRLAKNMMVYPQAHFLFVGAGDEVERFYNKRKNYKYYNTAIC